MAGKNILLVEDNEVNRRLGFFATLARLRGARGNDSGGSIRNG